MRKLRNEVSNRLRSNIANSVYFARREEYISENGTSLVVDRLVARISSYRNVASNFCLNLSFCVDFVFVPRTSPCFRPKFLRRILWRKLTLGENRNFKKKFLPKVIWIRVILWEPVFFFLFNSLNFYFKWKLIYWKLKFSIFISSI